MAVERDGNYSVVMIRDFGKAWKRRTARIMLIKPSVTEEELKNITLQIWEENGQDVDEMITVFFLPGMNTDSVAYSFGSCMKDGIPRISYR